MRKAKIVCTLGPATDSVEVLKDLIDAGMDVARLNMSHGTHDEHAATLAKVRQAKKDAKGVQQACDKARALLAPGAKAAQCPP